MTQQIAQGMKPTLSPDEWAIVKRKRLIGLGAEPEKSLLFMNGPGSEGPVQDQAQVIAIANAALADDDRRKIGWDYVDKLRGISQRLDVIGEFFENPEVQLQAVADSAALAALADVLSSYLPPRDVPASAIESITER